MNVFYAPVVQRLAHPFGGTLINLLDLRVYFRHTDFLQIAEILELKTV
jgi:hypothetical protein